MRVHVMPMRVGVALLSGVCSLLALSQPVRAEGNDLAPRAGSWFTQNGPIGINFRQKSKVTVNGAPAPAVEANPKDDLTISNAIGYNFTPNLSAQVVLGVTPETIVTNQDGARLGVMTYGAPSIVLDYKLTHMGAFQPFVGVGAMYIFVSDVEDGALTDLEVDDTFGLILRAGAEVMLNSTFGFYFAGNKIFADTDARGFLGANRVEADLQLDPWIFQGGMTYRF